MEDRENFKERFEYYVGCYASEKELLTLFWYTQAEMDAKCMEEFRCKFRDIYDYLHTRVVSECKDIIYGFGKEGHTLAMKIVADDMARITRREEQQSSTVTVKFDV